MATTSGASDFFLSNADVLIESFDRVEIRPPSLTGEHIISGRRSLNLELLSWNSQVPLLWKVDALPTMIPLQQGVAVYNLPTDTVTMLDTYIRTFQLLNQFNVSPQFTTVLNSTTVQAVVPNHGMLPQYWFQITTPIAVGGIVLFGFYQITTVIDTNTFQFTAATAATSGAVTTGTLPQFFTQLASTTVQVTLTNHGYVAGQTFNIAAQSTVGGITLLGSYTISSVPNANNFFIQTFMTPSSATSAYENSGQVQIQAQSSSANPIDRIITPISRTDYAQFPDKFRQTIPTQYFFERTVNPTVTMYQVPDDNGPYVLSTYLMRRIQNAGVGMGEIPDVHYLALDALCAKLAARLSVKYAKKMLPILKEEAKEAWDNFIVENREKAEDFIIPDLSDYYRT